MRTESPAISSRRPLCSTWLDDLARSFQVHHRHRSSDQARPARDVGKRDCGEAPVGDGRFHAAAVTEGHFDWSAGWGERDGPRRMLRLLGY
jgi:hypothetical protein